MLIILANRYTFAFNLSTVAAMIICPLSGFLLGFKADKSKMFNFVIFNLKICIIFNNLGKKQKLFNISLMQTISWIINIVACIVCMFPRESMIIPALVINFIARATIVGGSQAVIASL